MKSLGAAVASALLGVAGVYYGLVEFVNLDKAASAQLASAVMAAIPYVRELLDKTFQSQAGARKAAVMSIGDFGIPPRRMILYGSLIVAGAMTLGLGVGQVVAIVAGVDVGPRWLIIILFITVLIQSPAIFGVGRWVGRRCASHGLIVIIGISLVAATVDASGGGPEERLGRWTPGWYLLRLVGGTALISLASFGGYWLGRRQRVAAYFSYLLQSVSEDTRKAIVDLAFEEARAARSHEHRAPLP